MNDVAKKPEHVFDFSSMREVRRRPDKGPILDEPSVTEQMFKRTQMRDHLIEQVYLGRLTPAAAEKKAAKARLSRLTSLPRHGPKLTTELAFWTIEMTAAWIKEKSVAAVQRHYYPYYTEVTVWAPVPAFLRRSRAEPTGIENANMAYRLEVLKKVHLGQTYLGFDGERKELPELAEFFPTLRGHLAQGDISAVGTPMRPTIDRPKIDKGYWQLAEFEVSFEEGSCLRLDKLPIYRDIHFNAADILRLYPLSSDTKLERSRVRPWKKRMRPKEPYKDKIVKKLKVLFPSGIPDWNPKKSRDWQLRQALGSNLTAKLLIEKDKGEKVFKVRAFRTAMDRLLDEVLEQEIIWINKFPPSERKSRRHRNP